MATKAIVRKWGNSLGIILPKELVDYQHLKEDDKVTVFVVKEADLSKVYGSLKGKITKSGQEMKNLAREGWDS